MLKKAGLAAGLLISAVCAGWGQTFELPAVNNNVQSIKNAFAALVKNAGGMGYVEYDSAWTSSDESIIKRYTDHLDAVLNNMTFDKVRGYVFSISRAIAGIDRQGLSRRQMEEFEQFLNNANADNLISFPNREFLDSLVLNYDESPLAALDEQKIQHERQLQEYTTRLKELPSPDDIKARQAQIQERIKQPETQKNSQLKKSLEDEYVRLGAALTSVLVGGQDLTRAIRSIESRLSNFEKLRDNETAKLREAAESQYLRNVLENINNFYSWEAFFKNGNSYVRDFLLLAGVRNYLSGLVDDELPQRQSVIYRQRLDAFLAEWGI
jgi:hypothetical protein